MKEDAVQTFETLHRQKEIHWDAPTALEEYKRPAFPVDALPQLFQAYALAIADHLQMFPDLPALELLAAVSTACAGKIDVEAYPGWQEPIHTFSMVCLGVGERKSPALKLAMKPLEAWQAEKATAMAGDVAVSQSKKRLLQKKQLRAEEKGDEAAADSYSRQLAEFAEIKIPRILADDITPEALASILASNHGAGSIWSSEGGLLSILGGRYQSKDVGPNIDLILKAFSSDMAVIDRIGRPTEIISSPALTIMLAVQPDVLQQLMSNQTFMNRGLCGRFLYSLPDSMVGQRQIHTAPISTGLQAEYARIIRYLLDLPDPDQRHVLQLDADALQLFDGWAMEIEPKLAEDWKAIGGWANKLAGLTLRLAGQIHMAAHRSWEIPISSGTMSAAIKIGRYAVAHAIAAFGTCAADSETILAQRILAVIKAKQLIDFSRREIMRFVRGPKGTDFDQALALLEDHNFIFKDLSALDTYTAAGRPTGVRWIVNPAVTNLQTGTKHASRIGAVVE